MTHLYAGEGYADDELDCLSDPRPFLLRERVVERLQKSFDQLRRRLAEHLRQGTYLAPTGVDYSEGKIGVGEHLEGLPYVFVDLPRFLEKEATFTYRTLFWWGHGISFSLILEGGHLGEYRRRLLANREILSMLDVEVAIGPNAWDWSKGEGHTLSLTPSNEAALLRSFREQSYLKCVRFLEFRDPEFREGRVDEAALYTFQAFEPLILG
ncbi:MAG: hypothetical protein KC729_05145 [Candidatus Eisenbacteria bacterium]|uniref:Uncharacterized protein n=1 Tax=Eiseniibacteriota bacterium TaxID=2212470 RepID=A0A956RPR7_UNCEI|nr:hypothetical protein [Candidatus Eisenbacteria bacterium]